ncbi:sulfatase [Halomarina ordinaria]|uniref:Sulfatase n=1 Tax=Halomarina ordinaria TaxID=3033939 RepID=A0ABD5U491_9EURY|nr:sulfatase [Halomarina sp. PSRA2]
MSDARNLVLVTIDSLRADRCGLRGDDGTTMPALARLAREGLTFERAVAPAAATNGSAYSFLTGSYPLDRSSADSRVDSLRAHVRARETLAQRLSRRGYTTAAFTANPWTSRYFDFDEGFDHFEDFMSDDASESFIRDGAPRNAVAAVLVQALNWWQGQDMFMAWEAFYDDIREWLANAPEPYFLWLFLVDPHMPYLPPKAYRSQSLARTYAANAWLYAGRDIDPDSRVHDALVTAYDDTVRYTDAFLDRLAGDVDDDLLVVHADHGEAFGEQGRYGHGYGLPESIAHVPLVVANGPTGRVEAPFSLFDMPDLLTRLATDPDADPASEHDAPYARARTNHPQRVLRGRDWKYVRSPVEERLVSPDDDRTPIDSPELLDLCRALVDDWAADDAERRRLTDAAESVAGTGRV